MDDFGDAATVGLRGVAWQIDYPMLEFIDLFRSADISRMASSEVIVVRIQLVQLGELHARRLVDRQRRLWGWLPQVQYRGQLFGLLVELDDGY